MIDNYIKYDIKNYYIFYMNENEIMFEQKFEYII